MKCEPNRHGRKRTTVLAALCLLAGQAGFAWPDLVVTKTGPAVASVNDLIPYTLVYTNKGYATADCIEMSDALPPELSPDTNYLGGGSLSGNVITWSLGSLRANRGGCITFRARVKASASPGQSITNLASIQTTTAEDNTNNNNSSLVTRIVSIAPLTNQIVCAGGDAVFSTRVVGGSGYSYCYQWYKGTTALAAETNNILVLTNVSVSDAGTYSVVARGLYCSRLTNSATLTVGSPVVIVTGPSNQTACEGGSAVFTVSATGSPLNYQWYYGTNILSGQTGSSLVLTNLGPGDAGIYSVVTSGGCGESVTNSATLTVGSPVVIVTGPSNQTACEGGSAVFTVSATGSPLNYQWYYGTNILSGQTGSSLVLTNLGPGDAGIYSVVTSGGCGESVTNNATLALNTATTASPLADQVVNPGGTAVFTTTASGTGPFTYVWKLNEVVLNNQTGNSLVVSNAESGDVGTYEVDVAGACNTVTRRASLRINQPPKVRITSPTNGAVFIAPASFNLIALAQDTDGTISKVEFYSATNKIGEMTNVVSYSTNGATFSLPLTNLPPATNIFTAVATDNLGLEGTSAPVTVTIATTPPLSIVGSMTYDPLTDLFEQTVRVTNPTDSAYGAVRVYVTNLVNGTVVYNASGTTNGIPYVQTYTAVPPGSNATLVIEYYSPLRIAPDPGLWAELVAPNPGGGAALEGTLVPVHRVLTLPDGNFMVEFLSTTNGVYSVEYSSDMANWKSAQPSIPGTGTWIQWIDNGPPKTESVPSAAPARYYRVILLP